MEHNSSPKIYTEFLPISRADMEARGWDQLDFVVVGGDAYVDHPSFGTAIISRLLEAEGATRWACWPSPATPTAEDFKRFGKPKYGFFIGGGNVDSMVSHYSVAKIPAPRTNILPAARAVPARTAAPPCTPNWPRRPTRTCRSSWAVWKPPAALCPLRLLDGHRAAQHRRELRCGHHQLWHGRTPDRGDRPPSGRRRTGGADHRCGRHLLPDRLRPPAGAVCGVCRFQKVASDKTAYAKACRIQMDNQDVVSGQIIVQKQSEKYLVQNIPAKPLVRWELDKVYALPYTRRYHPIYEAMGGVPAIREVQFSIIQNRGCFGGCNFCAIQLHQGRRVTSRSADSIVEEAERMTHEPDFKGYIHDVGGPTANFRFPSCREQMLRGMCNGGKHCLAPTTCSHMIVDHSDYLKILRRVRELPGVKKVFIRSGIRFDYLMADPDDTFFKELVEYHVSGQLKVAPEHCAPNTLAYMGKPPIETFNKFKDKFYELSKKAGKSSIWCPTSCPATRAAP